MALVVEDLLYMVEDSHLMQWGAKEVPRGHIRKDSSRHRRLLPRNLLEWLVTCSWKIG